jgi:signal peptidase II
LKWKILFFTMPFIVILDQYTKWLVVKNFFYGESISVVSGFFNLTYVRNSGAAFGFLADAHPEFRVPFFIIVPVIAMGVIGYLFKDLKSSQNLMATALSLVVGGAIGNFIDRVRFNYVVDFLDFHWKFQYHFPAFNVAGSAICVGVGFLLLDLIRQGNVQEEQ